MAKIIRTVFQFRRAHTDEWLANKDVVPAAGEPCFDLDLHELRIGDGETTYENLPAIGGVKLEFAGDGKSIVLENNVFKLMGFDAAEVGAQPIKTVDGIKWVVPSTETVDGLQTAVSNLQSSVTTIQETVTEIREIVMPSEDGATPLLSRVETLEDQMGGVDAKIDDKIESFASALTEDGKVNTLMELIGFVESHGKEAADMVAEINDLRDLVGTKSVADQIAEAGHMTKAEAVDTLLSKAEAAATLKHIKYEIDGVPVGTLVDYGDKEIRVMVPAGAEFTKQTVGAGGDANNYYMTFKTYAPSDDVVGYIEHLNGQVDAEILTNFSVDKYGRRYQPTWLALARYDEATGEWNYYGKNSKASKYIGYDYQIDWYDANGVMVASDCIRINLSNEECHHIVEPYYMTNIIKEVSVNGKVLDIVDGKIDIPVAKEIKTSDEIEVNEDGTLSVKAISFSKIVQEEDDEIILNGGGAAG